jgi:hypothetical protein
MSELAMGRETREQSKIKTFRNFMKKVLLGPEDPGLGYERTAIISGDIKSAEELTAWLEETRQISQGF